MANKKPKRPPRLRSRDASRTREQYFRDVGTHPLMDKQAEADLGRRIASDEARAWKAALSYPPAVGWVKTIVAGLVDDLPSFAGVEAAAEAARTTRRKPQRDRLEAAAGRLATRLRERDRDHHALDELVARLDRLGDGIDTDRPPFSTKSRVFCDYRRAVCGAARSAKAGRHQFVRANLRLVVHIATRYGRYGVPLDDLIQEGNLGLMKAVDRFDYRRGNRFSTYATWWIHHTIGRAVADTSRTVRVPVHVRDTHQRAVRVTRQLSRKLGRPATDEEIAADMGISLAKLQTAKDNLRGTNLSLDEPVGEGAGSVRQEVFVAPERGEQTTEDAVISRSVAAQLRRRLGALTEKEADIIRRRFGLDGGRAETLREIAAGYGLSRERIRQLEAKALEKLRKHLDENGDRGWSRKS